MTSGWAQAPGSTGFDRQTGRVTLHVPLADPVGIGFYEDRLGAFWITHASGSGLAQLDRDTGRLTPYSFYAATSRPNALTGVMGMVEDDAGELWIGSPGIGLLRFDRAGNRFVHYSHREADPSSIPEDKVIALTKDREGNIWVGHHSVEPSRFNPRPPPFEVFRHEPGNPDSLEVDFVNAMLEDTKGRLWIGTDLGITRIDRVSGAYTRFSDGLGPKPMVITAAEDRTGAIWIGTYGSGIARLDEATGAFKVYSHDLADPGSLCSDQVHFLFVTRDGTLWAGTDAGLCRFDPPTERFTTFGADPEGRRTDVYVAVVEDADGVLWLGTHYTGLHRFDPRTGTFEIFAADPSRPGSLRDNMVPAVHVDRNGTLWVGTQSGLDRFDRATGRFTPIFQSDAPSRTVSRILEDRNGRLWISSNRGLTRYDPADGSFRTYTSSDGLPGNDLTGWATAFQSRSGEMFFGGFSGGIAFFPDRIEGQEFAPPIALTAIEFPFLSDAEASKAAGPTAITYADRLVLAHGENSIVLGVSALSFSNPAANRYRFKLEGLDDRWREGDADQRTATFTTLSAGRYTFRAEAATGRSGWGEPGITLPIEVLPAWWATWWFRGGAAFAVLGMVAGGYRMRVGEMKNRERAFRKLAENAPDMVLRFGPDLRPSYANPAALAFLGTAAPLSRRDSGETSVVILPVETATLRRALETRRPVAEELVLDRPSGPCHLEARVVPEAGDDRGGGTLLVIIRDITERKRAEAAVQRFESELAHLARVATVGELTTNIAHEVNQPLSSVVTNAEAGMRWLGAAPPNVPEASASFSSVVRDARRASDIITRIAALVRKVDPQIRPFDLNAAVREIGMVVDRELRRAEVDLHFDLAPDLSDVLGDRVQLQQVVLNLVKNALEAIDVPGVDVRKVTVETRTADDFARVCVRDTGPGIGTEAAEQVFAAFHSTKPGGMGMGLAISRSIVETHGGTLELIPDHGSGAHFVFTVPFAAARTEARLRERSEALPL